jgi:hypothetical protein
MNKTFWLFFSAFLFLCGIWFLQAAFVPLSKMKKIEARVLAMAPTYNPGTRSGSWHLVFTIDSPVRNIEIYYSTQTEAAQDSTINILKLGESYTFYINSSDLRSINAIDNDGRPVYRKPKEYQIFMGLLLSFTGLIGFIVAYQIRRPATANKPAASQVD